VPIVPRYRRVLGQNLRALRKRAGLSQEKLAERANLHPTYLSDSERGVENVSLDVLMRLAGALRSSIHDLVEGI
jgi:XRE family transcriptional regulator, regulator of sulfur utilization